MPRSVVLYNPQAVFYTMPLGLLAVGSALDRDRYSVRIIDARVEAHPYEASLPPPPTPFVSGSAC